MAVNYAKLLANLGDAFIHQDQYFFKRYIPEFIKDGAFLGDYFNDIAVEPLGNKPPRFYHVFSPFDVISNKAPERAVVFENGELLLQIDFDEYIALRTAAMNAVLLQGLGVHNLASKKVLLFGSGKIATAAVKILAAALGLQAIDIISRSGDLTRIKAATKRSGVAINPGNANNIGAYDIILCHTQASEPVITKEHLAKIAQGAVLASFISSTEHGEFPDEVFTSSDANIITDWRQTLTNAKDLKRALESGLCAEPDLIYIKDLLTGRRIDPSKRYTVYRSTGTPIQNLAALKMLVEDGK